jgi:hypothetical protein
MTAGERIYRMACLAYPAAYRQRVESELVASVLTVTDEQVNVREVVGLVAGGIRRRHFEVGRRGVRDVVSSGLVLAVMVTLGSVVVSNAFVLLRLLTPYESMDRAAELVTAAYLIAGLVGLIAVLRGQRHLAVAVTTVFAVLPVVFLALGHSRSGVVPTVSDIAAGAVPLLLILVSIWLGQGCLRRGSWWWIVALALAIGAAFIAGQSTVALVVLTAALLFSIVDPRVATATAATLTAVLLTQLSAIYGPALNLVPLATEGIVLTGATTAWAVVRTYRSTRPATIT